MGVLVALIVFAVSLTLGGFALRIFDVGEVYMPLAFIGVLMVSAVAAYSAANKVEGKDQEIPLDQGEVGKILRWVFRLSLPLAVMGYIGSVMVVVAQISLLGLPVERISGVLVAGGFLAYVAWVISLLVLAHRMGRRWLVWMFVAGAIPFFSAIYAYWFFWGRSGSKQQSDSSLATV